MTARGIGRGLHGGGMDLAEGAMQGEREDATWTRVRGPHAATGRAAGASAQRLTTTLTACSNAC
jgi:hypothetical protein